MLSVSSVSGPAVARLSSRLAAETERSCGWWYTQSCVHASRRLPACQRERENLAILDACQHRRKGADLRTGVRETLTKEDTPPEEYDKAMLTLTQRCVEASTNAGGQ